MIEIQTVDGVAVVTLRHGKVNAMDVELLETLAGTIRDLEESAAEAVVLTAAGSSFSAGVNLRRVIDEGEAYAKDLIGALSAAFRAWFATPLPVVAAINGHAIAGGCVLAATADRRIAVDTPTARVGASELRIGVPFPIAALEVLRHACGDHAEEVILGAGLHAPAEARRLGILHRLTSPERLLPEAVAMARELSAGSAQSYALAKRALRAPTLARMAARAADDVEVARLWAAPEIRDRIAAAMPGRRGDPPAGQPHAAGPRDGAAFAQAWAAAWNARDVEAVLAHFSEKVVFSSPLAAQVVGGDGVVHGKAALRAYWNAALERVPDLHFEVLGTYPGQDLLVIHYRNQKGVEVCEVLHFEDGLVISGQVGYGAPADPAGVG